MSKIYLINQWGTDYYKIGTTKNKPIKRRKQLQTGNPEELTIVKEFESKHPFKLEKLLHIKYSTNNCLGEWFELTDADVFDFINVCSKFEKTIIYLKQNNPFF